MNKARYLLTAFLLFACGLFSIAAAQDLPGKRDSINSGILNEKRIIQVVLPKKYKPGAAEKYDVLYVLDGEGNTQTAADIQRFVENEGFMPPTIIVGILNTDRNRDFLPTHNMESPSSGGADRFLSFIKDELIPYIDKTYPTDGDNTIFGHSYGGVLVTYALLNEPALFKSYIAADPSYWWDKGVMCKQVKDRLPALANINATLYITGREGSEFVGMGIPPMDTILRNLAPKGLKWKITAYPDETHGSVRLKSIYDGLKFSYAGFNAKGAEFHPMGGIVLKGKPFKVWCFSDTARLRYTVDGTEPTASSPKMQSALTLNGPAKFQLKIFTGRMRYNKIATGDFTEGNYLQAAKKPGNLKPGGFNYSYYEGQWDKLPDFKSLKPVKTGIADSAFSMDKLPRQNNFALVLEGKLEVKEEGYYVFGLGSDDGSKMYLNNQLIMDDDGLHSSDVQKSYILPLTQGFYPVRIEYFQKDGGRDLKVVYLTPSTINTMKIATFPFNLQYGKR